MKKEYIEMMNEKTWRNGHAVMCTELYTFFNRFESEEMCPVLSISEMALFLKGPCVRPLVLWITGINNIFVNCTWVDTRWQ
jgi:hypothetical protein